MTMTPNMLLPVRTKIVTMEDIKRREALSGSEVNEWCLALHKEFDTAYIKSNLPDYPDYEQVNAFLIRARRSVVD